MSNMRHHAHQVELSFIKRSSDQFAFEVHKMHQILGSRNFDYSLMLEVMGQLVAIKENIESLENKF